MLEDIEGSETVISTHEVTTAKYSDDFTTSSTVAQKKSKNNNDISILNLSLEELKSEDSKAISNVTEEPESKNVTHLEMTGKVGILVAAKPATEIVANLLVGCIVERSVNSV